MDSFELNEISNELYNLTIYLHRKIFNPNDITKCLPIPPSHVKVIFFLKHCGTSSISETAKHLDISRPNMTPIIDKLISEGYVNRFEDPNDRRVLRIELTDKAYEILRLQEKMIKDNLAEKISSLSQEDLNTLNNYVTGMVDILSKIE